MTAKARPLFNRVFVKETEVVSQTGIVLPKGMESIRLYQGEVIAVGPEVDEVVSGDIVFWGKYAGGTQKIGDEEFVVLNDDDLIGVIEEVED